MFGLLLPLVYLSFVSLGLPDAMLGAAWPTLSVSLGKSIPDLGLVSMASTLGAAISSLVSGWLIHRFGTGRVLIASVFLTALMLLLYSFARSYAVVLLLTLPLGMGGGAVDAGLNGFVARNFEANHMSWLHFMWGVGATLGPLIIGFSLRVGTSWPGGYRLAALLQAILCAVLAFSLPLWRRAEHEDVAVSGERSHIRLKSVVRTPGLAFVMASFACFVGFESTAGIWAASFLEKQKGFEPVAAATFSSLYFLGTTLGRAASGFIALKIDSRRQIRLGCLLAFLGALLLLLPLHRVFALAGYVLLGLGNAPIFPSLTFLTPRRFGFAISQAAIGLQMASAYLGSTLIPPLTGILVRAVSLKAVPYVILLFIVAGFFFSQMIDARIQRKPAGSQTL